MASLNQQRARFHVVILLFIVSFVFSSSLGNSLSAMRNNAARKNEPITSESSQTTPPPYPINNSESEGLSTVAVDTESLTPSSFNTLPISLEASDSANSTLTNTTLSVSSPSPTSDAEALDSETPLEAREKLNWLTEDLLVPVPRIVKLLAKLMTLSMTQLDTAFRGSSQRNPPSTSIQYGQSFRTTLLQISQKLSEAFFFASTNSEKIESSLLDAPEKVKLANNYVKKFKNSSRNAIFFVLPLNSLKETTDKTVDLSSQIVSQFSGLVQLTDAVIETVSSSKTEKEEQREAVIANLQTTQTEKTKIENELINIEKEIKILKGEMELHKIKVEAAIDDLEQLKFKEKDESKCYWSWDQKDRLFIQMCPYRPDSFQIRDAEIAKESPQKLFELTLKQLDRKEIVAQGRKEKDNKLLIRMRKLFTEKEQMDADIQLLETSSAIAIPLAVDFRMLESSWLTFVGFCEGIQEGSTKSHALVNGTIKNPSSWNSNISDVLAVQLKDTQENISLLKTIFNSYLEGYKKHLGEIVADLEQMMTLRGNARDLERPLQEKCEVASRGIENLFQSNSQLSEVDSRIVQKFQKPKILS